MFALHLRDTPHKKGPSVPVSTTIVSSLRQMRFLAITYPLSYYPPPSTRPLALLLSYPSRPISPLRLYNDDPTWHLLLRRQAPQDSLTRFDDTRYVLNGGAHCRLCCAVHLRRDRFFHVQAYACAFFGYPPSRIPSHHQIQPYSYTTTHTRSLSLCCPTLLSGCSFPALRTFTSPSFNLLKLGFPDSWLTLGF